MAEICCEFCGAVVLLGTASAGSRIAVECGYCGSAFWTTVPESLGAETIYYPQATAGDRSPKPTDPIDIDEIDIDDPDLPIPTGTALLIPGQALRKPVEPPPVETLARASLVVEGPKRTPLPLARSRTEVGRKAAHIVIADPALSASHFVIEQTGENFILRDLGSSNGTRLNGHQIRSARLETGDKILAGETTFIFRVEEVIPWDPAG